MVYNSVRCEMKRYVFLTIGAMMALLVASGCTKVVTQSSVHEISITFDNAAGNQMASKGYAELENYFHPSDAVLVYMYVGSASGEEMWMPLPMVNGNELYEYAYTDNGIFAFTADAGEGYTWVNNFSKTYRIILVPRTAIVSKSAVEVDRNDYNSVMKAYNLYECNVIR